MDHFEGADFYRTQSLVSDPGRMARWLDDVPSDLAAIREAAGRLVFHYRAHGDLADHGFDPARLAEINLRYAEDMFARVRALNDVSPAAPRPPLDRMVGCCRDFSLLFVAMARHHGFAARSRVGFASYFIPGWHIDHVVPEVWHNGRWRLMEPEIEPGYVDPTDGAELDPLDLPRDRFIVGPQAWRDCRSGAADPETFVVAPQLPEPFLRSWPYLQHNLVLDLIALNKQDAILWDTWGLINSIDPADEPTARRMDRLATRLLDPDLTVDEMRLLTEQDGLRIPGQVTLHDPVDGSSTLVALRR